MQIIERQTESVINKMRNLRTASTDTKNKPKEQLFWLSVVEPTLLVPDKQSPSGAELNTDLRKDFPFVMTFGNRVGKKNSQNAMANCHAVFSLINASGGPT